MQRTWQNGRNPAKLSSSLQKEELKAFTERNFARLCQKYPFLPKAQIRHKVKRIWEKMHVKKRSKCVIITSRRPQSNATTGTENTLAWLSSYLNL